MIGALIGAGLQVAGSVAGGIAAKKAARKQARMLAAEKAKNQAWYDRRYNEDATQRADAQSAINRMREVMKERSNRAAGTAAVMGASEEVVAAEKEAQNRALSDTMSNIAASGVARKDAVEQQYLERDANLSDQQRQMSAQTTNHVINAIGGVGKTAGSIASSFDSINEGLDQQKKEIG